MNPIRGLFSMIMALGILVVLLSHFGHVHPAFDSLAALRVQVAVGFGLAVVLAVAFGALTARVLAVTGLVVTGWGIVPQMLGQTQVPRGDVVIYNHNLRWDNAELDTVAAAIRDSGADVATLQEVSSRTMPLLDLLKSEFPYQAFCEFSSGVGGVAIISRIPIWGEPGCARGLGLVWAELRPSGARSFQIASLHLSWPWPHRQAVHLDRLEPVLAGIGGPLVIAGDFNMAPWGHAVDRVAAASGTRLVRGVRLTLDKPEFWPGLPIDHVLVDDRAVAAVEILDKYGSDHHALLARVIF